jgi:NADPH:quinone reductase-like Zn-dependent oxidoreductase
MPGSMKAIVIREPGGPEVLKIEKRPIPNARVGEVLIRVEAFGLNRSELFTRRGLSPGVRFPRVLGIEAVGTVADSPGREFLPGTKVATVMGGMGREFDGGYAEYTLVPAEQVRSVATDLPWAALGALPEMLQTAWGALFRALRLKNGERLLIRGGTTSVGLAAAAIAEAHGAEVAATSRRQESESLVRSSGVDHFIVDTGRIAAVVRKHWPGGANKILELVGTATLGDSLSAASEHGTVCMAGMVGDRWSLDDFAPMDVIPTAVLLTTYSGGVSDFLSLPLQQLVDAVAAGSMTLPQPRTFHIDQIVEAHEVMESNAAGGKIVILTR